MPARRPSARPAPHRRWSVLALLLAGCAVDEMPALEDPDGPDAGVVEPLTEARVGQPPPIGPIAAAAVPGRATIVGFTPGVVGASSRFWLNHGANALPELTGPNDRQVVGDFMGAGHDQVLFLNYWGGARRLVIADFWANPEVPSLPYVQPWGDPLLNGWDDRQEWGPTELADDLAIAGDFMGRGHDQLLLLNRQTNDNRLAIVDFASGTPEMAYLESWAEPGVPDAFTGGYDDVLAGDFTNDGYDQVMFINTEAAAYTGKLLIRDFSGGRGAVVDRYDEGWGPVPTADVRHRAVTKRMAGDFLGRGYDQVLFLNPTNVGPRVAVLDYSGGWPATMPFWEYQDSVLLNGWHDDDDWQVAGDFAGLGRDQVLFMNRSGTHGRFLIADFGDGVPAKARHLEQWGQSVALDGWQDDDDLYLAGRFTAHATDGLLLFNNAVVGQQRDYRTVSNKNELVALLRSHYTGVIQVESSSVLDFTGAVEPLVVRSGISLRGGRGGLNAGALLMRNDQTHDNLLSLRGNDISIENLRIRGAAFDQRHTDLPHQGGIAITVDPALGVGKNIRVTGSELSYWLGKAVVVTGPHAAASVATIDRGWPVQGVHNADWVRVSNNYIHHNVRDGAGYGVLVEGGAYVTVEGNVFDYNRHAISGSGYSQSGFIARYNYVQAGGFQQCNPEVDWFAGCFWNQHFDMHGANDGGYGGMAGEYMDISYNFFRGEQQYYVTKTRPVMLMRGTPAIGADIHHNVWVHDVGKAVVLTDGDADWPVVDDEEISGVSVESNNRWDTDHATDIATGDFDGDGVADVFVGTGAAWYYSSGGRTEWRYLNAAAELASQLAFADLDGDRVTDVIAFDPVTYQVQYSRGGTGPWTYVTLSPQPLGELRFFDFNGDGYADIFRTFEWQWWIMDGKTALWSRVNSASNPVTELRFGEFDAVPGADILGIVGSEFVYSSGARSMWTRLSNRLLTSLANTVVADFDGDGRSDLAWRSGSEWRFSSGARASSAVRLRAAGGTSPGHYPELRRMAIGNFDPADAGVEVLTFQQTQVHITPTISTWIPGPQFVMWRGLGVSGFGYASAAMLPMM